MKRKLASVRLVVCVIATICASSAHCFEATAELYSNTEVSDNVNQVSTDTKSEASQLLGLTLGIKESRKAFQADANFKLEKEHYFDDAYADRTSLTTGFGLLNFGFIESFLDWRSSFSRTEVLNDPLANDNPDNRGFRNIFRTGPIINYKTTPSSNIRLSANYINSENSDDDISDTERVEGALTLSYAYNSRTTFNVNNNIEDVIDGDEDEEYKHSNLSLGFVRLFNRGSLSASIGRSSISPESSDDTEANFVDIQLEKSQFLGHDFRLSYLQDISDTAIGFDSDEENSINDAVLRGVSGNDIVERRRFLLLMEGLQGSVQYNISGFWEEEDYNLQRNDERSRGLTLGLNHYFTKTINMGFEYDFLIRNLLEIPSFGKEKLSHYKFDVGYDVSKDLNLSSYIKFEQRQNSSLRSREYEEWSSGLTLKWTLW